MAGAQGPGPNFCAYLVSAGVDWPPNSEGVTGLKVLFYFVRESFFKQLDWKLGRNTSYVLL